MRSVRGRRIAMIFQEPMTSLNPVLTIGDQIGEVLQQHHGMQGERRRARVLELLDAVGIPDVTRRVREYPHQLSGGMKQRVMIAIALAGEPRITSYNVCYTKLLRSCRWSSVSTTGL